MTLINPLHYLQRARNEGWAVGAFNISGLIILQGIIRAAQEINTPIIIAASPAAIKHMGLEYISATVKAAAKISSVPVALHLDHCHDYDLCVKAIKAGFTSLMIDGSKLPYEENIAITKKVVALAHKYDVMVESELGKVAAIGEIIAENSRESTMTDPNQGLDFVSRTGIDTFAVAIGTAHGFYKGEPKLDFERLSEIAKIIDLPLILHGASGVPEKSIREAVKRGISKVNVSTELKAPYTHALVRFFKDNPGSTDYRAYTALGRDAVTRMVKEKLIMCSANNRI